MEFDLVQRRADAANYYIQRHKNWDPTRGNGDLYLQHKKKFRGDPNGESILRFATADEIHRKLGELEQQQTRRAC
jgi:hypothetical protein